MAGKQPIPVGAWTLGRRHRERQDQHHIAHLLQQVHVYAGLAILNPAAKQQIRQYAESVTELYKLMIGGHREELKRRVKAAGATVFKAGTEGQDLLLKDEVLDQFSLSNRPREKSPPNSHLSLLAIVDCWSKLGIVP